MLAIENQGKLTFLQAIENPRKLTCWQLKIEEN